MAQNKKKEQNPNHEDEAPEFFSDNEEDKNTHDKQKTGLQFIYFF
jgi:hypothetical protein